MTRALRELAEEDEAKVALLLLRKKAISEGQLRAALDYQRSLGGNLVDVLLKLDLVRPAQLEGCLEEEAAGAPTGANEASCVALDPASVKLSDLKVHRRLLDKVPRDFVEQHLVALFFPLPSGDPRKIVLGHGTSLSPALVERIRSTVGVDLCTLALEPRVVQGFLGGSPAREAGARPKESGPVLAGTSSDAVLQALVSLLTRKGLFTKAELEAEMRRAGERR